MVDITKTYTEAEGHKPFDWHKALTGPISFDMWSHLRCLASQWVLCACGSQCAAIPRDLDGEPRDPVLKDLGIVFMQAISMHNAEKALRVLNEIEVRSGQVLKNMGLIQ